MASPVRDIGTGITITLPSAVTTEIKELDGEITRESFEATHFGSPAPSATQIGGREFEIADLGMVEMTFTIHYNPDTVKDHDGASGTFSIGKSVV